MGNEKYLLGDYNNIVKLIKFQFNFNYKSYLLD